MAGVKVLNNIKIGGLYKLRSKIFCSFSIPSHIQNGEVYYFFRNNTDCITGCYHISIEDFWVNYKQIC